MPPTTILPDDSIVNVQMFGTLAAQRIITTFQYRFDGIANPALDYTDYLVSFEAVLSAALNLEERFLDVMPANYLLDFVRLQPVYPTRLRKVDFPKALAGLDAHNAVTPNIAASIERFGVTGRRHGVGRVQLPIPDSYHSNGVITSFAYLGKLTDLGQEMASQQLVVVGLAFGTWDPVIINVSLPNPTLVYVSGSTNGTTVRTMHRRTVGLGI